MTDTIHAIACQSIHAITFERSTLGRAIFSAMDDAWFERLIEVIEEDHRSYREISLEAKLGENYVQQLIKNRKVPGTDKLLKMLSVIGFEKIYYVITGVRVPEGSDRFLRLAAKLDAPVLAKAEELLDLMQAQASQQETAP